MDEQLAQTIFTELRKRLTKRLGRHQDAALSYLSVDELKAAREEYLRGEGVSTALQELESEYARWKESVR